MKSSKLLIYNSHGTYGRDDDAYGALLASNSALAKGMEVSLILVDDGVCMAKANQDTAKIGLPNNLEDIGDLIDLDGVLYVVKECLEERGIANEELIEDAKVITFADIPALIEQHDISLTF
jgi:sulfur relay (sulfurtransferase) DsrF/TusC family protein